MHKETHYKLLKLLESQPSLSQRALARRLGVSLGKVNYCIRALADAGMIRPEPDAGLGRPLRYRVTARGCEARKSAAAQFLAHKTHQLEALLQEIERLKAEIGHESARPSEASHVRR